jgi:hypothetical protein
MLTLDLPLEKGDNGHICPDDPIDLPVAAALMGMPYHKLDELFQTFNCRPTIGNLLYILMCGNLQLAIDLHEHEGVQ